MTLTPHDLQQHPTKTSKPHTRTLPSASITEPAPKPNKTQHPTVKNLLRTTPHRHTALPPPPPHPTPNPSQASPPRPNPEDVRGLQHLAPLRPPSPYTKTNNRLTTQSYRQSKGSDPGSPFPVKEYSTNHSNNLNFVPAFFRPPPTPRVGLAHHAQPQVSCHSRI
nr:serine/arginine repetitive matrix protein 1-like [Penaeus vannamei]